MPACFEVRRERSARILGRLGNMLEGSDAIFASRHTHVPGLYWEFTVLGCNEACVHDGTRDLGADGLDDLQNFDRANEVAAQDQTSIVSPDHGVAKQMLTVKIG